MRATTDTAGSQEHGNGGEAAARTQRPRRPRCSIARPGVIIVLLRAACRRQAARASRAASRHLLPSMRGLPGCIRRCSRTASNSESHRDATRRPLQSRIDRTLSFREPEHRSKAGNHSTVVPVARCELIYLNRAPLLAGRRAVRTGIVQRFEIAAARAVLVARSRLSTVDANQVDPEPHT